MLVLSQSLLVPVLGVTGMVGMAVDLPNDSSLLVGVLFMVGAVVIVLLIVLQRTILVSLENMLEITRPWILHLTQDLDMNPRPRYEPTTHIHHWQGKYCLFEMLTSSREAGVWRSDHSVCWWFHVGCCDLRNQYNINKSPTKKVYGMTINTKRTAHLIRLFIVWEGQNIWITCE